MFARSFPRAFICLRCQSRLFRRNANAPFVPSPQRSPFSSVHPRTSPPDNHGAVPTPLPSRYARDTEKKDGEGSVPRTHPEEATKHPFGERFLGKANFHVLGKVRGLPGGKTREGSTSLSIDSLGKPTEIIVLRDVDVERVEQPEDNSPVDKQSFSHEAILQSIEDEKIPLDQATINQQIDTLRPRHTKSRYYVKKMSLQYYGELSCQLQKDFTSDHLREYCRMAVEQSREEARLGPTDGTHGTDKSISLKWNPWRPGTTPIDKRAPADKEPIGVGRNLDWYSKKGLAKVIIQSLWNIQVSSDQDVEIGELEFQLKPWEISLLTAGSKDHPVLDVN
jgi:hypothetical protein